MPYIGNITSDFSIDTGNITNRAVTATKLSPSSVGSNGQVLSVDGSGNLQWSADANAPEGTAVLSTGESGTTKFLRVDGDGTCSWQVPPNTQLSFSNDSNNRVVTGTGSGLNGEANLTFDGSLLTVTGNSLFAGQIQFSGLTTALTNISQPIITRSGSDQGSYPFDSFGHLILQSRGDGTNKDIIFATGTNGANKSIIKASGTVSLGGTTQVRVGNALELYNGFDNKQARIQNSAGSNYANLLFKVNHNGTEATPFSLHPDSTADFTSNVGFGTSSPDARVTVDATSNPTISIKASGTKRVTLSADTGGTEGVLATYEGYPLKFSSSAGGGTNIVMTLLNDGNVGIGTAAPSKLLHLSGGSSPTLKISVSDATPGIFLADSNRTSQDQHLGEFRANWNGTLAGRIVVVAGPDTTNKDDGHMDFYTSEGGSNVHRMRIKHNGYIGIGTLAPTFLLDIRKDATAVKAHIGASDGTLATMPTSSEYGLSIAGGNLEFGLHKDASDNYQAILGTYQGTTDIPLVFRTASRVERLRIAKNGTLTSTYPTVTTYVDTPVAVGTGDRFTITLPDNSRMFRIQGSFSFADTNTYRIWGDFGDWSDSHSASLEGFAYWWEEGAAGPTYQDTTSGRYFEVADPVEAQCLEVTYDIVLTNMAFFHGGSENQGGGRPGVSGTIRWTRQNEGNALTIFSYQDTAAKATDRLVTWTWDIDQISGTLGAGKHHYVIQALPLTGDAQNLGDAA